MPDPAPLNVTVRAACLALSFLLLAACGDSAQPEPTEPLQDANPTGSEPLAAAGDAGASAPPSADGRARPSNEDPRPSITPDMLDAYIRGMEEEIVLMRAAGSHFISLSRYSEEGLQVAEKAGLPMPEYRGLRRAVTDVLYAHSMHERYAGPDGKARLARLEAPKREHALKMLASEPFATLSPAERKAVQARLGVLRPLYDRYMEIAAIAD